MKKIKRILVGIDVFSKSNNILRRAWLIAKENQAELFIVHVVETPWFSLPTYFGGEEIHINTKSLKNKIEKKLKILNKNFKVPYSIFIEEGSVSDILLYEAKLLKTDILIIGSNTKKKKKFLGTSAEKIVHQSHLSVLVVKNSVKHRYKNILAATDFQTQSIQSILFAKDIFPEAKITAVHSFEMIYIEDTYALVGRDITEYNETAKENAEKSMKNIIKDFSLNKGKILDMNVDSKKALTEYIKNESYDLILAGSRSYGGFTALLGSFSSSLVRKSKTDVLVYVP